MADERSRRGNRGNRDNRREQRPKMPEPSVSTSLRSDGKHSVFVSLANERHEPRRGVQVTFIQEGVIIVGATTITNENGMAACVAEPGKIIIQVPGFPAVEKDLEKPSKGKPATPTFPKAPRSLGGFFETIRRAWHDGGTISTGGTP